MIKENKAYFNLLVATHPSRFSGTSYIDLGTDCIKDFNKFLEDKDLKTKKEVLIAINIEKDDKNHQSIYALLHEEEAIDNIIKKVEQQNDLVVSVKKVKVPMTFEDFFNSFNNISVCFTVDYFRNLEKLQYEYDEIKNP